MQSSAGRNLVDMMRGLLVRLFGHAAERAALAELDQRLTGLAAELSTVNSRVEILERRLLTYYRERYDCIDKLADYLVGAQLVGDYLEFGVYEGTTFMYAMSVMAPLFPDMRFIALDSFEGLPAPRGIDAEGGYSSGFRPAEFACDETSFRRKLVESGAELARVRTVPGWFEHSLRADNPAIDGIDKVAAAWIDCDLYESTVPVLDFLVGRLQVGSVLLFDDWRCFRNLPTLGEQRACNEWLARNPAISLQPFVDFGFHGAAFTVARC